MAAFERVLALVDLRGDARELARYAMEIAQSFGSELTLLHVADSNGPGRGGSRLRWPECTPPRANSAPVVHRAVVYGTTPDAMVRYADFIDADLLVVGDVSRPFWKRLHSESVAERIAAATSRPILTAAACPAWTFCATPVPRILCVPGAGASGPAAIEYARWLAEYSGGELLLYGSMVEPQDGFASDAAGGRADNRIADELSPHLQPFPGSLRIVRRNAGTGHTSSRELRSVIERHGVDLVVAPRNTKDGPWRTGLEFGAGLRGLSRPLLSIASPRPPSKSANDTQPQAVILGASASRE